MRTLTREQILAQPRVKALRDAVVAQLQTRFVDLEVRPHIGKLDISDVVEKSIFNPPSIAVAATRVKPDGRLSGADDFVVDLTAYVVAEDLMVCGARVERDEMAIAICEALLISLADDDFADWGAENVGLPDDAQGQPLFTIASMTRGAVYYAVTWRQTLYAVPPANFWTADGQPEGAA